MLNPDNIADFSRSGLVVCLWAEPEEILRRIASDANRPLLAYANDVSYEDVFVEQLKNFLSPGDLVIAISGSGNSRNVLKAVEYANERGGRTFGICGYGGGLLKKACGKSLFLESMDMQKVEDAHVILIHCVMQYLRDRASD